MADMSWHSNSKMSDRSAVLDMDAIEPGTISSDRDSGLQDDYSSTFPSESPKGKRAAGGKSFGEDMRQRVGENVTQMMWQAGAQSARRAWNVYGNIDLLRPYFDVEPKEVQSRLVYSLVPMRPTDTRQEVPKELYGPTMVVLTLIALLLYQMKSADHRVEEGTLIGSAFAVCFMYWLGASALVWFVAYVCEVRIAILQILSMMGYALFGHCIVLFLGTVIHTSHDHMFFYLLWAVVGGLSTLRMAGIIMSRTRGSKQRLIVTGTIATLHLFFLLYLHFAYHTIVEEISDAFHQNFVPVPASVKIDVIAPSANVGPAT
ncbi:protein yipf3 [Plakobranchus ocellatus]|uniref:Protein YIPF3 n=1 Tax=Plakobranchus ocellatus TaxID=259542 RepID=A0AAV3Y121_9GAST|nr:protein yipf3 [Plakobranchus ocellatus]